MEWVCQFNKHGFSAPYKKIVTPGEGGREVEALKSGYNPVP